MVARISSYIPQYLYRYRSLDGERHDREIDSMQQQYLWCGILSAMNDPMEGQFIRSRRAAYNQIVRDQKSQIGICSFSETPDNVLMWAHYADQFRGICIEYNFELLREDIEAGTFVRVQYADKLTRLSAFREPFEAARSLLQRKSGLWVYEREWRLLTEGVGRMSYVHLGRVRQPITRIFVGSKAAPGLTQALQRALPDVDVYRMRISGYQIEFPGIDSV